jgi:dCMP deaminase
MNWDTYYYNICNSIASNSKCFSRMLGAVIVRNKYIISTGYNGPPSGCVHCDDPEYRLYLLNLKKQDVSYSPQTHLYDKEEKCPRREMGFTSGTGLEYCQASHAERNAIYAAARLGHSVDGGAMYLNWIIPCFECCKGIINSGIKEVIVTGLKDYEQNGITGRKLLEEANIKLREYNFK